MLFKNLFIATSIAALPLLANGQTAAQTPKKTPLSPLQPSVTAHVDPFWGVERGNVLPGAILPFSMVRLSPDVKFPYPTTGYTSNGLIEGFSHTHLSGTGGGGRYGNILVIPQAGEVDLRNRYSVRSNEAAAPGYYAVTLGRKPGDVHVELTLSPHVGMHRYHFYTWDQSKTFDANLLIDVGHTITRSLDKGTTHSRCTGGQVRVVSDTEIEGYGEYAGGWGGQNPYAVYFVAQFDTPFKSSGVWSDSTIKANQKEQSGTQIGAYGRFTVVQNQRIQLKVAISFVSVAKARQNMSEIPGWDFDAQRIKADQVWNNYLGKVKVEGGTPEQQRKLYGGLYHTMIMPTDVTGENPKWQSDKPAFWEHYCLWDVFRSVMPLHTLILPQHQSRVVQSLLNIYDHTGWLPDAWIAGNHAQVQGGSNADVVIADAVVKGLPGFDWQKAYTAIKKNADVPSDKPEIYGRMSEEYLKYGFVSSAVKNGSSRTMEYAYNDFCVAQVAQALGKKADAELYRKRSLNVFNLFNPETKFFWAKSLDGKWAPDFSPTFTRPDSWNGPYFYEGSPWDYSAFVPQDVQGLINRHGGKDKFVAFLDEQFDGGHYSLGNEQVFLTPYLYNYAGRPDKTADRVRDLVNKEYKVGRKGLPGQDDSGALSSWYVFSSMGFFPVAGQDLYLIGSPVFAKTSISLAGGKQFIVTAANVSAQNKYIQSAKLNGKPLNQAWFKHTEIANGGTLELIMGNKPSTWSQNSFPPSITSAN